MSDKADKVTTDGTWNRTRDGREAGVYWVGNVGNYPVHGWYACSATGDRIQQTYSTDGHATNERECAIDLIRERKAFRFERWAAVFKGDVGMSPYAVLSHSREQAINSQPSAVAYVKVIIEGLEGDGLEGGEKEGGGK